MLLSRRFERVKETCSFASQTSLRGSFAWYRDWQPIDNETRYSCLLNLSTKLCPIELWPVAMEWHGVANANPGKQNASFIPQFLAIFFYFCFIFVDKERSLEILVELSLGLCDIHVFFL